MNFTASEKILFTFAGLIASALCAVVILVAEKGEKRLVRERFIRGFFFWPEVSGDKVPRVARLYKVMAETFACSFMLLFLVFLFCLYRYW